MGANAIMRQREQFISLMDAAGVDSNVLADLKTAHIAADGQMLVSRRAIPGISIVTHESSEIISAEIIVARNSLIANPVHLCFGLSQRRGNQRIKLHIRMEEGAKAFFIAHGLFTNAEIVGHSMEKIIEIGERAEIFFSDCHIHGISGGIQVNSTSQVKTGRHGCYYSDFSLTTGRVGKLTLNEAIRADDYAIVELTSRIFGHENDSIKITEQVSLDGTFSHSMIKSRIALEGEATAEIVGITEGRAEGARGHMDCMEIIKDRAVGQSSPIVKVSHPLAKITHEAAIGTIDKKQMETLIAHGLSPEQATDMIVLGLLR